MKPYPFNNLKININVLETPAIANSTLNDIIVFDNLDNFGFNEIR